MSGFEGKKSAIELILPPIASWHQVIAYWEAMSNFPY